MKQCPWIMIVSAFIYFESQNQNDWIKNVFNSDVAVLVFNG